MKSSGREIAPSARRSQKRSVKSPTPLVSSVFLAAGIILCTPPSFAADKPLTPHAATNAPAQTIRATAVPQAWIAAEASKLANSSGVSVDGVSAVARQKLAANNPNVSNADVEALAIQVLQKANEDAAADLKSLQAEMKANAEKRKATRETEKKMKEGKDALAHLSSDDHARLQLLLDRKATLEKTLSNLLKKSSDTSASVTGNLK